MRAVFGLVLLVGMGLAGFAIYMVKGHFDTQEARLSRERARAQSAVVTVDIYAPSRDLTYGDLLTIEDVKVIQYAQAFLPDGVYLTEDDLFPDGLDTPRVVTRPMDVNEPIMSSKVTAPGAPRGITALLRPGMRAYPLNKRLTSAFGSELRPTDRIDLYWSGRLANGAQSTSLILTGLEIIASESRGVTLEVTPQDFAAIRTAERTGALSVTPVGTGDDTIAEVETTNIRDVLGIVRETAAPVVVEEKPEECFITMRNGSNVNRVRIRCADE